MGRDLVNRVFRGPESEIGPLKPRAPNPGLHLPPGAHIPDWKIYKIENHPELLQVQKRLAAKGLKANWLRNEAWRYDPKEWGTEKWRRVSLVTYGWKYAIPMLVVTFLYEKFFRKESHDKYHPYYPSSHGHGHGHH